MQISTVKLRAARELGLKPLVQLGAYRLMHKSGWLRRRTPTCKWDSKSFNHWVKTGIPQSGQAYVDYREKLPRKFLINPDRSFLMQIRSFHDPDIDTAIYRANRILEGYFPLFGDEEYELGFPPAWNTYPAGKAKTSALAIESNSHWTTYDIENTPEDVKFIWEPSRFGWAFALGRAYLLSDDPTFADGFWDLLVSWRRENLPNAGPQWMSAQEVAIRVTALVFCFYAFLSEFKANPERITTLAQMIAVHVDRIPHTVTYSRAQGNNHLLLEAVALYTVGLIFPEFRRSDEWRTQGRRLFIEGVRDQVFLDGGYVQHSTNYHRLALEASCWLLRLAVLNGETLPEDTTGSIKRMAQCLRALVDPISGKAVNLGHNDGGFLFPLTNCSFDDYRPTLRLASNLLDGNPILPSDPWDELPLWFGISNDGAQSGDHLTKQIASPDPSHREEFDLGGTTNKIAFPQAGFHILRGRESWGMLRCANFSSRPAHSDQLHFDLWWRGENILLDAGTYLYNGEVPWQNSLSSAHVHNSPVIDELEPMDRVGTFLWLNWSKGKILKHKISANGAIEIIVARHDSYRKMGISVSRTVIRAGDQIWQVLDEIGGEGTHSVHVGWLLPDVSWKLENQGLRLNRDFNPINIEVVGESLTFGLVRAGEHLLGDFLPGNSEVMGWYSPTYARKDPALAFLSNISGSLPLRIETTFNLGDIAPANFGVQLSRPGESDISIKAVNFLGERLEV
jgi:asparagine synthase (glutamine-hydrolysing)